MDLTGFDPDELDRLLAEPETEEELTDPDIAPLTPRVPVTVAGDLWILGDHRLLCGDATDKEAMETLLAGETAGMVFTRSIFCGNDDGGGWKQPGSRSKSRRRHSLPAVLADRGAWWRFCAKPATATAFEAIAER